MLHRQMILGVLVNDRFYCGGQKGRIKGEVDPLQITLVFHHAISWRKENGGDLLRLSFPWREPMWHTHLAFCHMWTSGFRFLRMLLLKSSTEESIFTMVDTVMLGKHFLPVPLQASVFPAIIFARGTGKMSPCWYSWTSCWLLKTLTMVLNAFPSLPQLHTETDSFMDFI